MKQPEAKMVKKIIAAVKGCRPDAVVWKLADRFRRGIPDLMILLPCPDSQVVNVFMVEVKRPGGKLSKLQQHVVESELGPLAIFANFRVVVVTSVEEVMDACSINLAGV